MTRRKAIRMRKLANRMYREWHWRGYRWSTYNQIGCLDFINRYGSRSPWRILSLRGRGWSIAVLGANVYSTVLAS